MVNTNRQLNAAPNTYETQLAQLKASRKHYTINCVGCGVGKTFFPNTDATDLEIEERKIKRQRSYTCDTCAKRPRLDTATAPSAATVKADATIKTTATDAPKDQTAKVAKVAKVAATGKLKISDMLATGKIKFGDILTVARSKFGDSTATLIDAKSVRVTSDNSIMSLNAYGQRFTGHVAVNVYKHVLVNGTLLETLR